MDDDMVREMTDKDFTKARGRAMLSQIQHFINSDRDRLLSFNIVKHVLQPKNQVYMGNQTVPIKLIIGSEGRYHDFNKFFLPKSDHLRKRWEHVDEAHIKEVILPPIQLYEIGGVYFVRDGNHRVSVAKAQGVEFIDAEVTSLTTEIHLDPSMTVEEMKNSLIKNEKNVFYENTSFGELTGDNDLDFTSPGRYDVIYEHILEHKYYMNQNREGEIPFSEALVSWYTDIYNPVIKIIKEQWLLGNFPGRSASDLYVWIMRHWDYLKSKYGTYSLEDAVGDYFRTHGNGLGKFFRGLVMLVGRLFAKKKR